MVFKLAAGVAFVVLLGAPSPGEVVTGPGTRYFSGPPPVRFVKAGVVPVVFVAPSELPAQCGLAAPAGLTLMACTRRTDKGQAVIFMPHPCLSIDQPYALILCHETAHALAAWPGEHPV